MRNDTDTRRPSRATRVVRTLPLLLPLLAGACSRAPAATEPSKTEADAPPIAVKLVPAREVKTPRVVTLSGTLIGAEEADVAAGAAGKVLATYIERGSYVRKGALLAKLDARAAGATAAQAAADL
ncbi:MAG: biotin/lipoyl-binding protein, partial [Pseudomonadota bacterium]